jgi:hypothetical protein
MCLFRDLLDTELDSPLKGLRCQATCQLPTLLQTDQSLLPRVFQMVGEHLRSNMTDAPTDVPLRRVRAPSCWGAKDISHCTQQSCWANAVAFSAQMVSRTFWTDSRRGTAASVLAIAPAVLYERCHTPFAGDIQSYHGIYCAWLLARYYRDFRCVRRGFPNWGKALPPSACGISDRLLRFATSRDWLDLGPNGRPTNLSATDIVTLTLLGTAWFAQSARMMADVAAGLDG